MAFLLALTVSVGAFASKSLDDAVLALRNGNAAALAALCDAHVEVSVAGRTAGDRAQAESLLKDFFDAERVRGFEEQTRNKNNGVQTLAGKLTTQNGSTFKVTVTMKQKDDRLLVQTLTVVAK